MLFVRNAVLLCLLATLTGCSQSRETANAPTGATGVCFRRLQWWDAGKLQGRSEALVVRSSSDVAADMRRLAMMEFAVSKMPDLVTNTWLNGWLTDDESDLTRGPSCAGLPVPPKDR